MWHSSGADPAGLLQNLRSNRETELAETWPMHVVCVWIGNSPAIARKHYLQVTDEHFESAVAPNAAAQRCGAASCRNRLHFIAR